MDLARYVVEAVVLEGRSYRDVAAAHGVSKSWVGKLVGRYEQGGYDAIAPRSKTAHRIPHRTAPDMENEIVALRKELAEQGLDHGAQTIHYHLAKRHHEVPSVTTIWRVLRRRGFVVPQPHKRPKSSWIRFEAQLPNECWQSDVTMYKLADGREVEILNFIDDFSRVVVASRVFKVTTAPSVLEVFGSAGEKWGLPASLLTDNGCIYTTRHRGGTNIVQTRMLEEGIEFKHSRPYHPQTCGKVERFHQTLKKFLDKQPPARSITQLQSQVDRFIVYYNQVRPHRARGRKPPLEAFESRDKAKPSGPKLTIGSRVRVRHDKVDNNGKVTLRHAGKMHHIGIGWDHRGKRITMLIDGLGIKVLSRSGELLREFTLDPSKIYQGTGLPPGPPKGRKLGPRTKNRPQ